MVLLLLAVVLGVVGFVVWRRRHPAGPDLVVISYEPFRGGGVQVKPTDFIQHTTNLTREAVLKIGGRFEFYPALKVVSFNGPSGLLYAYCNPMEYFDVTCQLEDRILYGRQRKPADLSNMPKFKNAG